MITIDFCHNQKWFSITYFYIFWHEIFVINYFRKHKTWTEQTYRLINFQNKLPVCLKICTIKVHIHNIFKFWFYLQTVKMCFRWSSMRSSRKKIKKYDKKWIFKIAKKNYSSFLVILFVLSICRFSTISVTRCLSSMYTNRDNTN